MPSVRSSLLLAGALAVAFWPFATAAAPIDCARETDWNASWQARNDRLRRYRAEVEAAFLKARAGRPAPSCSKQPATVPADPPGFRVGCVSTKGIAGLDGLPCFRYRFIPGRESSTRTVISFMGGPGDAASAAPPENFRYDRFARIVFDDAGIGENSFSIGRRFRHSNLLTENQTELVRRIIQAEKLREYVLEGGSFGTVSATIVGSRLSRRSSPGIPAPVAVVLTGVSAPRTTSQSDREEVDPSDQASRKGDGPCLLPTGRDCLEDAGLALLTQEERRRYRVRVKAIFDDPEKEPLQRLLRDAVHWMKVHDAETIAAFVRGRLLDGDAATLDALECWYRTKFSDVPWLVPHRAASQAAFSGINGCFTLAPAARASNQCRCFESLPAYDPSRHQIAPSTIIVYVNGDSDPQTPLSGAQSHFEAQRSRAKALIRVCGGGHFSLQPGPASRRDRYVSADDVLDRAFAQDLAALGSTDGFCGPEPANGVQNRPAQ